MISVPCNLFDLIKLCSSNIKGLTKAEDIEKLLPIETDSIKIQKVDKKIIVSNQNNILGSVWIEIGCYSNLKLLTLITKIYDLEPISENIFELMKYKYKIDNMFIKEK